MTQSNVDLDFLNGLHLMINSIESSTFQKEDDTGLPEADHWCPDVQAWHTADHEPANPPTTHINVSNNDGDDPYVSENSEGVEKQTKTVHRQGDTTPHTDAEHIHGKPGQNIEPRTSDPEGSQPIKTRTSDKTVGPGSDTAPPVKQPSSGTIPEKTKLYRLKYGSEEDEIEGASKEYDQNTNLPPVSQEHHEDSIAEPFLRRRIVNNDEDEEEEGKNIEKSLDALKIWASVEKALPKIESNLTLIDDINILKSFNLDETTNVEDIVGGTLLHKMLTDRTSRPTAEWWDASMLLAKSNNSIDEPAFFSAFLYYEPDNFDVDDFLTIEKAEPSTQGKPQDLEMMPNSSGGSAIDGLGLMADGPGPDDDEDCD
tara:strand:+ start:179 stop:1288 length:1110 start_codon:yes stop_codon:yes gene_type:complete